MSDPTASFVAALDNAATLLLEKAGISAKVADGKSSAIVTVAEQVKAFEAVVDWAKTRRELAPKPKEKSAFDDLKSKFKSSGAAPRSRGNARRAVKKVEGGTAAADADSAEPATDAGLFGSDQP